MLFSYSYEAAEDNEITFMEGERIVEIEPASEEWWQGKNKAGQTGLFPGRSHCILVNGVEVDFLLVANYVEVEVQE